jgi:uncharacterized protein (DUF1330 family)
MSVTVIGIFKKLSSDSFEEYRSQVGASIELYGGQLIRRGVCQTPFWNQLNSEEFDTFVELSFPTVEDAKQWANSPEYEALLPVRNRAMRLTLFTVET